MTDTASAPDTSQPHSTHGPQVFGQPRGLATLFFTEMWERFTYYGMRAILVLFMTAAVVDGGLGIDDRTANAIYGMYISGTYLLCLLGGWIADRLLGQQKSVFVGGVLIMIGNASLAIGDPRLFFVGLVVIVCGVGLLKPNISAIVAQLYPEGGSRRDAGFSIFYMGINLGAFFGSLFVPIVAAKFGWNIGFALPAIGMLFGLIQFHFTRKYLGGAGVAPPGKRATWWPVIGVRRASSWSIAAMVFTGKTEVRSGRGVARRELGNGGARRRLLRISPVVRGTRSHRAQPRLGDARAVRRLRDVLGGLSSRPEPPSICSPNGTRIRHVFGFDMPAGVLQAVNPLFIIIFAPVFAAIWVNLGRRNMDLSSPAKFGVGLIFMGLGFLVMFAAAGYVVQGQKVLPTWLILTYLLHTFGELCLSPVGLSSMTKLAPARFVGQVMGVWFLATAIGNNLAGQFAGEIDPNNLPGMPGEFLYLFWWGAIAGAVMLILTPFIKRLMSGVK